jgi:hypothetical protein
MRRPNVADPGIKAVKRSGGGFVGILPVRAQIEFVKTLWDSYGGDAEWHALGVVE